MTPQLPLRFTALFLLGLAPSCHHPQSIIAVTEERFRMEIKHIDSKQPPNPTYSPLPLPLTAENSARLAQYLTDGMASQPVRIDYAPLLTLLSDTVKHWTFEDILDKGVFKQWLAKPQVGGVVDAREEKPPSFPPIAARSGPFWWIFQVHGHDITGLTVFKEAVTKPQPRSKH